MKTRRLALIGGLVLLSAALTLLGVMASRAQGSLFGWLLPSQSPTVSAFPTPNPAPVLTTLPDVGVHLSEVRDLAPGMLSILATEDAAFPRLVSPDTSEETLVGVVELGQLEFVVVAIDLTSGAVRTLSDGQDYPGTPAISGKHVVWTTLNQVHSYDLETEGVEQIATGIVTHADVSGDTVVWVRESVDVWGHSLSSGESFPVAADPAVIETLPMISGDWVIYLVPREPQTPYELRVKNIRTGEDLAIGDFSQSGSNEPYIESLYTINASWIAWSAVGELHLYNLDSRITRTVSVEACLRPVTVEHESQTPVSFTEPLRPTNLALSGSTLILVCGQPLGYDIEQDVFFSLPILPAEASASFGGWAISGDQLVWVLTSLPWEQEESHIYAARITR